MWECSRRECNNLVISGQDPTKRGIPVAPGHETAGTAQVSDDLSQVRDDLSQVSDDLSQVSDDLGQVREAATRVGGHYLGAGRAAEFGARNGVPGELMVRVTPARVIAPRAVSG